MLQVGVPFLRLNVLGSLLRQRAVAFKEELHRVDVVVGSEVCLTVLSLVERRWEAVLSVARLPLVEENVVDLVEAQDDGEQFRSWPSLSIVLEASKEFNQVTLDFIPNFELLYEEAYEMLLHRHEIIINGAVNFRCISEPMIINFIY